MLCKCKDPVSQSVCYTGSQWDGLIRKYSTCTVEFNVPIFFGIWELYVLGWIQFDTPCTPNIETLIACSAVISSDCVNFDSF